MCCLLCVSVGSSSVGSYTGGLFRSTSSAQPVAPLPLVQPVTSIAVKGVSEEERKDERDPKEERGEEESDHGEDNGVLLDKDEDEEPESENGKRSPEDPEMKEADTSSSGFNGENINTADETRKVSMTPSTAIPMTPSSAVKVPASPNRSRAGTNTGTYSKGQSSQPPSVPVSTKPQSVTLLALLFSPLQDPAIIKRKRQVQLEAQLLQKLLQQQQLQQQLQLPQQLLFPTLTGSHTHSNNQSASNSINVAVRSPTGSTSSNMA